MPMMPSSIHNWLFGAGFGDRALSGLAEAQHRAPVPPLKSPAPCSGQG